jgi:hypothetical protein
VGHLAAHTSSIAVGEVAGDVTVGRLHRPLDGLEPAEPLANAIANGPRREVDAVPAVVALHLGVEAAGGVVSPASDVTAPVTPHQAHATETYVRSRPGSR